VKYFKQYVPVIEIIGIQPKNMNGKLNELIKKAGKNVVDFIVTDSIEKISMLS
jgi:hypothetical protein